MNCKFNTLPGHAQTPGTFRFVPGFRGYAVVWRFAGAKPDRGCVPSSCSAWVTGLSCMAFIIRSYSVIGSSSGSQPRLRVRLPCGLHRRAAPFCPPAPALCPDWRRSSFLAVPPFWLARLITCASIFYRSLLIGAKKAVCIIKQLSHSASFQTLWVKRKPLDLRKNRVAML